MTDLQNKIRNKISSEAEQKEVVIPKNVFYDEELIDDVSTGKQKAIKSMEQKVVDQFNDRYFNSTKLVEQKVNEALLIL
ncbi:MAG TPA: hypothetical protein PLH46_01130 [Caldisericia bacterium]|nr:hypothetical protein [Caldisericia bacterium]